MSQRLHLVALQPALRWQQPMPNMMTLRGVISNLPASVNVVVLPEMWPGLSHGQDSKHSAAQAVQFLQTTARTCDVNIVGGSFESDDGDGAHNVCVAVDRTGQVVGQYAKRVLFGLEQDRLSAGNRPVVVELDEFRIGLLICADLWRPALLHELIGRVDAVCVPAKTAVPSDEHVEYARELWFSLALVRSMETGIPLAVSDWAGGRHAPVDVDRSVGSVHASGMNYDRGVLYKRHTDRTTSPTAQGPAEPTATAHSSAAPTLGVGVHFTAGAASICNPARRPDIRNLQQKLPRGEPGLCQERIDPVEVARYCAYRRTVGLLSPARSERDQAAES